VSDEALRELARRVGVAVDWTNAAGERQRVAPDVLRRLLEALGLPSGTPVELSESRDRLAAAAQSGNPPPLVTADAGKPIMLKRSTDRARAGAQLILENGTEWDVSLAQRRDGQFVMPAVAQPGYHTIHVGDQSVALAVAPARCFSTEDIENDPRLWGLAAQIYGLRRRGDGGIGDSGGVCALATGAAKHGADAIALSPTHAQFGADGSRYGPYSPSSRLFLNPLLADPDVLFGANRVLAAVEVAGLAFERARLEACDLIDWPAAASAKLALLRRLFEAFRMLLQDNPGDPLVADFAHFRQAGEDLLEQHARFEALHAVRLSQDRKAWSWRDWPAQWRDPGSAAVREFAAAHAGEITFHAFLQWVADRSLAAAQAHARRVGMRVGLIADLAVGMDSAGSHAWSRQDDVLLGLNVGAPPDLFNPRGQNWGLTAFSPHALREGGFEPFIATLRAAMRDAGGVRIDHALGLARLWLIPDGGHPRDGAYLAYPLADLLRLIKLESSRHQAIVIGEDLGTVPEGFREQLAAAGVAGMRVLWFERDEETFALPDAWPRDAVAMTTTHDLPTVAGWWRGVDIDVRAGLGTLGTQGDVHMQRRQRDIDRELLWDAFRAADAASDAAPPSEKPGAAVDAAVNFIAGTPSSLVLLPMEDALGLAEQPNLPGTIEEHPNWRRRYQPAADEIFDDPAVVSRAQSLSRRRRP
jgi:4-alpha-glucanotransferase